MMLIPYVVCGGLCAVVSLAMGAFDLQSLLVTVAGVLGLSVFYFSSATFVSFLTGNLFAMPALYFLLHFLAPLLDWLVSVLSQSFLFGLWSDYSGIVEWLSPTVYLTNGHLNVERFYQDVTVTATDHSSYTRSVLQAVEFHGLGLIGLYVLAGLLLVAAAYGLYRLRRSEWAGDVVAGKYLRPVFRFGVSALAALLGGQLLYEMFFGNLRGNGAVTAAVPMALCLSLAGLMGYYAASMLLAKSLRVFRGSMAGAAAVVAGCALVCWRLHADIFGVTDRVPALEEIRSLSISTADNSYTLRPGEDDALIQQVRTVHQAVVADKDYAQSMVNQDIYTEDTAYTTLWLSYTLKNGAQVERRYPLYLTRSRLAQEGTYEYLLDALVNSREMKEQRLHLNDDAYTISGGSLYVDAREEGYDLGSRESAALLEAIGADLEAGTWGNYTWFNQSNDGAYALGLDLQFTYFVEEQRNSYESRSWVTVVVWPDMVNTVACLQELGLVTEEDLITYNDLYAREEAQQEEAWQDTMDMEAAPNTSVSSYVYTY